MRRFQPELISKVFSEMTQLIQIASTGEPSGQIPANWRIAIAGKLEFAVVLCTQLSLPESMKASQRFSNALREDTSVSNQELLWKLDTIRELIESEMRKHLYFTVQDNLAKYVDGKDLFGPTVAKAFPSIQSDLREAGNCLACSRNPAAGFHLMRVAEIGLRELGRDRQIPLATSDRIEFSEWGKIIGQLEDSVKAIQNWPNSAVKEEAHKFYNYAVVELRAFNDGWRRHAVHPRANMPPMSPEEALALWGHVERFMKTLAGKISEGENTNLEGEKQ
jgi:hypothetical protein